MRKAYGVEQAESWKEYRCGYNWLGSEDGFATYCLTMHTCVMIMRFVLLQLVK